MEIEVKNKWLVNIFIGLFVVLFLSAGVVWTIYKFNDCKKVGHSEGYCIMKIFTD